MTTPNQIAANRKNAQKSSGPKSTRGKVISSGNARRHGLAGALDADAVTSWYRVILQDEEAVPHPFEQNDFLRAAAELARAEAHLQRVRIAQEQWLLYPKAPVEAQDKLLEVAKRELLDIAVQYADQESGVRIIGRLLRMQAQESSRRHRASKDQGKKLARYRATAEVRRRKALALWTSQGARRSPGL